MPIKIKREEQVFRSIDLSFDEEAQKWALPILDDFIEATRKTAERHPDAQGVIIDMHRAARLYRTWISAPGAQMVINSSEEFYTFMAVFEYVRERTTSVSRADTIGDLRLRLLECLNNAGDYSGTVPIAPMRPVVGLKGITP